MWFPKGEMTHLGKFKKIWFGPFRVQYCLSNNIVIAFVNNFEPNPILVNVNKLKPYKDVEQTLKGIQSSDNHIFLESIDLNHREEKSNEDSEDQKTTTIINTNQMITSKEALVNLMS